MVGLGETEHLVRGKAKITDHCPERSAAASVHEVSLSEEITSVRRAIRVACRPSCCAARIRRGLIPEPPWKLSEVECDTVAGQTLASSARVHRAVRTNARSTATANE